MYANLFRKKGFKNIDFRKAENGRDVYDFLVNYTQQVEELSTGKKDIKQIFIDMAAGVTTAGDIQESKTIAKKNLEGMMLCLNMMV